MLTFSSVLQSTEVVRDLLSKDPVQFNSTINAHFASSSTYHGHGLKINGASQIKHAAYLLNVLDLGSGAKIADRDIRWDAAGSIAIVKATRHVRPVFLPLFQLAVPTKVILSFNAEEGAKDTLYCTQWRDDWPVEEFIYSLPVVGAVYSSLWVPLATMVFLWASNLAFWLHSKVETVEHRYARDANQVYKHKVEPRLPLSLTKGFDHGVQAAEHVGQHGVRLILRVSHKPLKVVEELARTATVVSNLALPHQLQIPYPSVFAESPDNERAKTSEIKSRVDSFTKIASKKASQVVTAASMSPHPFKVEGEGSRSPKSKVSGPPSVDNDDEKAQKRPAATEQTQSDSSGASSDTERPETADAREDHKRKAGSTPSDEPRHAKVVIGPARDDSQQPQEKEINLVTHEVAEKVPTESAKESLYQVLKKEDQLPTGDASARASGNKKSGKKKAKSGGRK